MKQKKKVLLNVHLFEISILCAYFHDMAKQGWMLTSLHAHYATFKRIDPRDLYFYISFAKKYSYFSNESNISDTDKDFIKFVEGYGVKRLCQTAKFQVFVSKQEVDFPFYDGTIETYLQTHKKEVLRYEWFQFLIPNLLMFITFSMLIKLSVGFFIDTTTILMYLFVFPCMLIELFTNVITLFLWLKKKEAYHTGIHSIRYKAQCIAFLGAVMVISVFSGSAYLSLPSFVPAILCIGIWCIITFMVMRFICASCSKPKQILLTTLSVCLVGSITSMLCILPMRDDPVPAGANVEFTSSLYNTYSFDDMDDSNQMMFLHRSQNKVFDRFVIDHIVNGLQAYEVARTDRYVYYETNSPISYIVSNYSVLEIISSSFDESQIPMMIEKYNFY